MHSCWGEVNIRCAILCGLRQLAQTSVCYQHRNTVQQLVILSAERAQMRGAATKLAVPMHDELSAIRVCL